MKKEALFLTWIGQDVFTKLKTLMSPTSLDQLSLPDIVAVMKQNYQKNTIEIVEWLKLLKYIQHQDEEVAGHMGKLQKLAVSVTT